MRHIRKSKVEKPYILARQETLDLVENLHEVFPKLPKNRRNNKELKPRAEYLQSDIYNGNFTDEKGNVCKGTVKEALKDLYEGKCAYCERRCTTIVEHYRPKLQVVKEKEHLGYYWLAYEWTNLVPTCDDCNLASRGGKGNLFPIMGNRVWSVTYSNDKRIQLDSTQLPYTDEKPYLLHPEIDKPADFLIFNRKKRGDVVMQGLNERGIETIKICNLNREPLSKDRWDIVYEIATMVERQIKLLSRAENDDAFFEGLNMLFDKLEEDCKEEKKTFTLLRKYVIQNVNTFTELIISNMDIPTKDAELIILCFEAYKKGELFSKP